jgi:GWxTD domain-containing protein
VKQFRSLLAAALLGAAFLLVPSGVTQQQPEKQQKQAQESKRSEKARLKELATPYRKWLDQEVIYIINDDERAVFLGLSTNEEREQFIEQFWLRRDPTPDTVENEYKEEHYLRIAYTNERFTVGAPGWMTDRGHIYILHGAPDQIDSHPTGGLYNEGPTEGTRMVTVYPYERWTYRYLEDIGSNITLEFVDKNSTGDYRLTADPTEKEIFTSPGALTRATEPQTAFSSDRRFRMMDQFRLYANVQRPPEVKFKDLEEMVHYRIVRSLLSFDLRMDFVRVTDESMLVPLTMAIRKKDLTFQVKDEVHQATLNVYGRISTITDRTVQVFEDVIQLDVPDSLFASTLREAAVYQKAVPLRSGLYKLVVVMKDVKGGNVGIIERRLNVPRLEENKLTHSSLILADLIEPAPAKAVGLGQFVIGTTKVRPMVEREFRQNQRLGIYMQVYNLGINETTQKPDATIRYVLMRGNQAVFSQTDTVAKLEFAGRQVTLAKVLPLQTLPPGQYLLLIVLTDQSQGESFQTTANFRIVP